MEYFLGIPGRRIETHGIARYEKLNAIELLKQTSNAVLTDVSEFQTFIGSCQCRWPVSFMLRQYLL